MKRLLILLFLCSTLLASCSNWTSTKEYISPSEYDPQKHARIRLIGGNNRPAIISVGSYCKTQSNADLINVGGFDDDIGNKEKKIVRLGMQKTERSQQAEQAKLVYRELIIPADTAITFIPYITTSKMECSKPGVCFIQSNNICVAKDPNSKWWFPSYSPFYYWKAFFAKAGQDYEYDAKSCQVELWDITNKPEKVPLHKCK